MELQLFVISAGLSQLNKKITQIYFCVNAFGGVLILVRGRVNVSDGAISNNSHAMDIYANSWRSLFIVVGMCIKLGVFPFPF